MPTRNAQTKSPIVRNLIGGLNVREAITDLADNEGSTATNVVYYTAGALSRRGGWTKLISNSPTALPLTGIYQAVFNSAGTLTYYLVITDGIGIWQTANPAANPVTWTSIIGAVTLDATQPYRFLMMSTFTASYMIGYNGKNTFSWTGSGNIANMPASTYILRVGDILLTAVSTGSGGQGITYRYTTGATAGAEVVSVVGNAISVQIADGVSTATQIVTALAASAPASALVTATALIGTFPQSVSSASAATPLTPAITTPLSRIGIVWQNFLFWGGDATHPSRASFSDLANPLYYPGSNYIDIPNAFDGDQITGFAILYGNLLVFKRFSIYILQGSPPGNMILSRLNASVGCVDPNSVIQVDNLVYFVSDKGLYAGNLFSQRQVCYKTEPRYLTSVPQSTPATPIWAAHYKQRGQIFIATNNKAIYGTPNGKNDRIMVHDYMNADANGDPVVSEFIVGFTAYTLAATNPSYATAPSLMGDYFFPTAPKNSTTVMASFYDPFVYVFTDGSLTYGGPKDEVSWLSSPTYPPADFASKFFDFGDPDMIKQMRWLWTTGQIYNSINLQAGLVYNNSPTTSSFVNFNSEFVVLQSLSGQKWLLGIDDDGAITTTATSDATFLTTLALAAPGGQSWTVTVDDDGAIETEPSFASTSAPPILVSVGGFQFQLSVDNDGALDITEVFAPDTTAIIVGRRVFVTPSVNRIATAKSGKYLQLYFSGIGILTQFSMDLVLKGRRN